MTKYIIKTTLVAKEDNRLCTGETRIYYYGKNKRPVDSIYSYYTLERNDYSNLLASEFGYTSLRSIKNAIKKIETISNLSYMWSESHEIIPISCD